MFTALHHWFRPESPRLEKFCRFAFFFALLAAVLAGDASRGFTDDESGYVALNTEEFASHPWKPYLVKTMDAGHPMIYAWADGVLWSIFGHSNAIAHVSIWCYGAVALMTLQRLMALLLRNRRGAGAPRWAGLLAALCLFSTPLFISHVSQYLDAIPYTAFLLLMVLAWAEGRRRWIAVWATLLALTRITGFMGVLGLGLFDLGYGWLALRRRSPRELLRHMKPYFISGGIFIAYWIQKMVILRLPFNNFKKNDFSFADPKTIRVYILKINEFILDLPRYSFRLLLWAIVAALAVQAVRWLWRRLAKSPATPPPAADGLPGPAAIYAALLASMLISTAFYCVYFMFPNPRWLISWHALLVLAGVHALVVLFGRWRLLAVPLLLLWCGLQATRWHQAWVEKSPFIPTARQPRFIEKAVFTLDINRRKALVEGAVAWMLKNTRNPLILCAYPTSTAFFMPSAGYTAVGFAKTQDFNNLTHNGALAFPPIVEGFVRSNPELYIVMTNFDKSAPLPAGSKQPNYARDFAEICRTQPFTVVFERAEDNHDWIKIYRLKSEK